jgi:hypothetical protein
MNETGSSSEGRSVLPLPLVIGVTGHRDLRQEDQEPLQAQVEGALADIFLGFWAVLLLLIHISSSSSRLFTEDICPIRSIRCIKDNTGGKWPKKEAIVVIPLSA